MDVILFVFLLKKDSFAFVNVFKIKSHQANLTEIRQLQLKEFALHFSLR